MARKLSYPFNTLEKVGDSFAAEPAKIKYGHPCDAGKSDSVKQAQVKANKYAEKHFTGEKILVRWCGSNLYIFERVAG